MRIEFTMYTKLKTSNKEVEIVMLWENCDFVMDGTVKKIMNLLLKFKNMNNLMLIAHDFHYFRM